MLAFLTANYRRYSAELKTDVENCLGFLLAFLYEIKNLWDTRVIAKKMGISLKANVQNKLSEHKNKANNQGDFDL